MKLPNRVFNSPLVDFVNFEDGNYINLIRLIEPYSNGDSYAVYHPEIGKSLNGKMFKTYGKALCHFGKILSELEKTSDIRSKGFIEDNF